MDSTEEKKEITEETTSVDTFSKKKKTYFVLATIILFILAGMFSFNMRSLSVLPQSSTVFGQQTREFNWARRFFWDEVYTAAKGNDRFFLQLNTGDLYPVNPLQCYKMLHEAEPKNPIYLSYYTLYLALADSKDTRDEFEKTIKKWKALDPNNAMPYFFKAYVLARQGIIEKKETGKQAQQQGNGQPAPLGRIEFELKNQAAADLALAEYKEGLKKKYASCYTDMAIRKKLESANLTRDPLGEIHRISIAASCIPVPLLTMEQDLNYRMAFLAETKAKHGNLPEAKDLVKSGEKYILLRLEKENPALINIMVYRSLCSNWLTAAMEIKDEAMTKKYDNVLRDFEIWRNSNKPEQEVLQKHGGIFIQSLVPSIKVDIAKEDYKPERMVNYLILDQYGLTALFTQLGIIILLLALCSGVFFLCKRKARWIQLPEKSYWFIGLVGVLLPLAIYLVWVHVPALSGREMNISNNQTIINLLAKYQVFISPLFFGIVSCIVLVKKANAKPLDCLWNLVFLLTVYLFLTTATLRIIQDIEISHYTKQDKLVHSESGFTAIEDKAVKELTGKLKKNLNGN